MFGLIDCLFGYLKKLGWYLIILMKHKIAFVLLASCLLPLASCGNGSEGSSSSSFSSSSSSSSSSGSSASGELEKTKIKQGMAEFNKKYYGKIAITPTTGNPKLLVIPTWFTDSDSFITSESHKENVKQDIESAFFGSQEEVGWYSIKGFYERESHGRLSIKGTISDWYECGQSSSYWANKGESAASLVDAAVSWYFENNPEEDRKDYDYDGDGFLDGVSLIYAAPDYEAAGDNSNDLWAYVYWIDKHKADVENPQPMNYFFASYDFLYGENEAKLRAGSSYHGGSLSEGVNLDTHTYIHESGHLFGLEDYYDTSYQYSPAGSFSMQDANVGGHDPYSLMQLGWADPYIPEESTSITISDFESSGDFILLTPEWNSFDSSYDEYLLLELYSPTGTNELDSTYSYSGYKGPEVPGIRLWHVDSRFVCYGDNDGTKLLIDDDGEPLLYENLDESGVDKVALAFSNTYYSSSGEGSATLDRAGREYSDHNLIQLIRNDQNINYRPRDNFSRASLFLEGDSFSMNDFDSQFVNGDKLNDGASLGWSFEVGKIEQNGDGHQVSITLTKA